MKNSQLAMLVSVGLLLASIANGAASYLKRIGIYERHAYESVMLAYCMPPSSDPAAIGRTCQCLKVPQVGPDSSLPLVAEELPNPEYVLENTGHLRWLKFCKDALFGCFMLLSLFLIRRQRARLPAFAEAWPGAILAASVGLSFSFSVALWGAGFALVGLRSFELLIIVLLGGWVVGGMAHFARCAAWLLVFQAVLVAVELVFGMPQWCPHWFRAAGTMVLPNSLGVVAVVALAFWFSFSPGKAYLPILLVVTAALVVTSGSGTGVVALVALLGARAYRRLSGSSKPVATAALLLLATVMIVHLPALTHRPEIYDSVFGTDGRLDILKNLLEETSMDDLFHGRGVGVGTNTAANLAGGAALGGTAATVPTAPTPGLFISDSTVIVMLTQLGFFGLTAFYWLLGWAAWRDPAARLTYLVVAVASLTINITEVFPVNFMLGIVLAHSVFNAGNPRPGAFR